MLNLFSDSRPVDVVQNRRLKVFRQAFQVAVGDSIGLTGCLTFSV